LTEKVLLRAERRGFSPIMRFLLLAFAFAALIPEASAVYYGQSRAEVIQELGKPVSALKRGEREVLIFKTGRIELEGGKVAVVQGLPVTEGPVAGAVEPAAIQSATSETSPAVQGSGPAKPAEATGKKDEAVKLLAADAAARAKLEQAIEEMENPAAKREVEVAGPPRWLTFLVELVIKALMMLTALWLTTKYWGVEISWRGLAMAATADTVTRAAVGGAVLWALGSGSTMFADDAVAALVLVGVLRKVSYNHALAQAVTITLTSKTFSIVVGSFLSTFLMHTLFGGGGGLMPF